MNERIGSWRRKGAGGRGRFGRGSGGGGGGSGTEVVEKSKREEKDARNEGSRLKGEEKVSDRSRPRPFLLPLPPFVFDCRTHGAAASSVASIVTSSPSILGLSSVVVVEVVVGFSASSAVMSSSSSSVLRMFARLLASLESGSEERARLLLALVETSLGLEDMVGLTEVSQEKRGEARTRRRRGGTECVFVEEVSEGGRR